MGSPMNTTRQLQSLRLPLRPRLGLAACLAGAALLSGCVVAPLGGGRYAQGEVVMEAPPPPRYEVIPLAPAIGWVWISGFWGWSGGHHQWNNGYWQQPPRQGYGWSPPRWQRQGPGWSQAPGRWERR